MADKQQKKSKAQKKAEKTAKSFLSAGSLRSDPAGSYTGRPAKRSEQPEQDGDDL